MSVSELLVTPAEAWTNLYLNSLTVNTLNLQGPVLTYQATLGDGANSFTATSNCTFYKLGHLYIMDVYIVWTDKGVTTGDALLQVSLPTTIGPTNGRVAATIGFARGLGFTGSYLTCTGNSGANNLFFTGFDNTGAYNMVTCSQAQATGSISLNFVFWDN